MATPIGTNFLTSISRRIITDWITDNIYKSNVLFFRWNAANKKVVQGGTQFESPLMYAQFSAGGSYNGPDVLDITPQDTVKNAAWDWRQYYVPVTVTGLDLIKADSPLKAANFIKAQFGQAEMEMARRLGAGLWQSGSDTKGLDGLQWAVDDTSEGTSATYGGLSRTSNIWWNSQVDATSYTTGGTKVALSNFQTMFGNCTQGGRHPTIIVSTQLGYNLYWNLNTSAQAFPVQPAGQDQQLAQAGFSNLLFNGAPWVVDANVQTNHVYFLNEDFFTLWVTDKADFLLQDFIQPSNQDVMTALLLWAGNLLLTNANLQGKMTSVAG